MTQPAVKFEEPQALQVQRTLWEIITTCREILRAGKPKEEADADRAKANAGR